MREMTSQSVQAGYGLKRLYAIIGVISFLSFFPVNPPAYSGQLTLAWDANTEINLAGYKVYWGTSTGHYGASHDAGKVTSYVVPNLTDGSLYYLAVSAYDSSGNESVYSNEVFKTIPDTTPPQISGVISNTLTSSGAVITWATDEISSSAVEFGATSSYGSIVSDSTSVTAHRVTVTGLTSWTSYHYRVKSQDAAGNQALSGDYTFTTLAPPDTTPPTGTISINSGDVYAAALSVTLSLSCSDSGLGCSQMQLSNDGKTWIPLEAYATPRSWTLPIGDGIKSVYVRYKDGAGNISTSVSDSIILDTTVPAISNVLANTITTSGAAITWTTVELSTTQIEYGTTIAYGSSTILDSNLVNNHRVVLTDLSPSTPYHYRVRGKDGAGNAVVSGDFVFTTLTPPDTTPPVISNLVVTGISEGGANFSWTTNELSTAQVEYGTSVSLGSQSLLSSIPSMNHTVILSGLNPDTTYHFKVVSQDSAGNVSRSSENIFVTLRTAPPDRPSAIMDLHVQYDASTRNSVVLVWTATGADGKTGTASIYDVRISKMKIVEDGFPVASGEVNFSNASGVAGLPSPQLAGTLQSVQVSGLETNMVYYFAIKATDEKGNISPVSNVINGDSLPPLPVTAVRQGYTMVSFPMMPSTTDVQVLLGDQIGGTVELYWWSSTGFESPDNAFVLETNVVPGYGYFLKSERSNAVLQVSGTAITDPNRTISLQPGWNMVGNPYPDKVALKDIQVRNVQTGEVKIFADAVTVGWVSNAVYSFNGSTYEFISYLDSTMKLDLWHGYWLAVLQDGIYELIIAKP